MKLHSLPNLALFTFVNGIEGYSKSEVWQKQFRPGKGPSAGMTIDYIAQAKRTPRGWKRDVNGKGGIGGDHEVILVARRRRKLVL